MLLGLSFPSTVKGETYTCVIQGQLPIPTSLVYCNVNYSIIVDYINVHANISVNISSNNLISGINTSIYLNSSLIYNNKTYSLPFTITQISGVLTNKGIVYYAVVRKGNITLHSTFFQVLSALSAIPNVSLYRICFNGTLTYTPIIK